MKTLIYYPALFCLFLLAAACKKNDNIQPRNGSNSPGPSAGIPPANSNCDTAKMSKYILSNSTGIDSFIIIFSGDQNYTFSFPAQGSKSVSLKPGTYNVLIPPANDYSSHSFSLYGQSYIKAKTARYENVQVNPCAVQQQAEIN
jgi:hypothetical protein